MAMYTYGLTLSPPMGPKPGDVTEVDLPGTSGLKHKICCYILHNHSAPSTSILHIIRDFPTRKVNMFIYLFVLLELYMQIIEVYRMINS